MKKVILSISFVVCSMLATAQSSNKSIVLDIETGERYLTDKITPVDNGVKVMLDPADRVRGAVPDIIAKWIVIYNGPSEKDGGAVATKTCLNTNIWPCMIVRKENPE